MIKTTDYVRQKNKKSCKTTKTTDHVRRKCFVWQLIQHYTIFS